MTLLPPTEVLHGMLLISCSRAHQLVFLLQQAQLALPVLVVVQAVTPPFLLAGPLKRRRLEPWRGVLHATNVVFAVLLARFAIFDILQVGFHARCAVMDEGVVIGALLMTSDR